MKVYTLFLGFWGWGVFAPGGGGATRGGGGGGGRYPRGGWGGGGAVGCVAALLNLLILGSKLVKPETGHLLPGAWLWLPGSILLGVVLGTLGAGIGG